MTSYIYSGRLHMSSYLVFMPLGYYCPEGTRYATEYPCPPGTYSNRTGLQGVENCTACPAGFFCDAFAQTDFSDLCTAG